MDGLVKFHTSGFLGQVKHPRTDPLLVERRSAVHQQRAVPRTLIRKATPSGSGDQLKKPHVFPTWGSSIG